MSPILDTVFLPGVDPSGRVVAPPTGRLSCPHCNELHPNPKDGFFNTWTWVQIRSLASRGASLVCTQCGEPSNVVADPSTINGSVG